MKRCMHDTRYHTRSTIASYLQKETLHMWEVSMLNLHATSNLKYIFRLQSLPFKMVGGRSAISWLSYPTTSRQPGRLRNEGDGLTRNPCRVAALEANNAFFDFLNPPWRFTTTSSWTTLPIHCSMFLYPLWSLKRPPALLSVRYVSPSLGFPKNASGVFFLGKCDVEYNK